MSRYHVAQNLIPTVTCVLAAFASFHASGQCAQTTLWPSDATLLEHAGKATAIQGFTIALGNEGDEGPGGLPVDCGSVDIFRFSNGAWNWDAKLAADNVSYIQRFGTSVDVFGSFCVVGAPGEYLTENEQGFLTGAVYVFMNSIRGWNQIKVLAPEGTPSENSQSGYGHAVAIDDDFVIVGAPGKSWDSDTSPGRAYVYRRLSPTNWVLEDTLPPNDVADDSLKFGEVVAMERGNSNATIIAAVGAPHFDWAGEEDAGEVMVFTRPSSGSDWGNGQQVLADDFAQYDAFGTSIDLDGTTMAVGASGCDVNGVEDLGAVYIFKRDANGLDWNQVVKLTCPDVIANAEFGVSVALEDDTLIVGSASLSRVYVYKQSGQFGLWLHDRTIIDPSPDSNADRMGHSVGLAGNTILAGDPGDDLVLFAETGGAHVFALGDAVGNDLCADADVVTSGHSYTGCTVGASQDGAQTCAASSNQTPDVWFRWTAQCNGTVSFDTLGSTLDTVLSIHDGCPGSILNVVACNDNIGPFFTSSSVAAQVEAGHVYRIRVAGKSGAVGPFQLNVGTCVPFCTGDLNSDGAVNGADLSILLGSWGPNIGAGADIDLNGVVDSADLAVLLGAWGGCL